MGSTMEWWRKKGPIQKAVLTLVTVLLPACATGQGADPPPDLVYVAVQGDAEVAVVDMATLEEVDRIDLQALGFSPNAKPHHIAVEPDGSHWYVSLIGENRILKFNRNNELEDRAEFEVPGMMAVHPTRDLLLVGRSMSAVNPPQRVGVVDRSGMDVEEVDVFFPRPHAIAVSADGTRMYTASLAVNQIGVVNLDTEEEELTDVPGSVHTLVQFAVSPDGRTVVATGQLTGRLLVFDMADPDHPALKSQIEVGGQPWHPVFSPDGRTVYFGVKVDDAVVAVDVATGAVVWRTRHEGIVAPHGAALSADGGRLFVSSNGPGGMDMGGGAMADHAQHGGTTTGTLAILDTRDGTVLTVLEMGTNATGVGAAAR